MVITATSLFVLGLVCLVSKRSTMGMLVGFQMLSYGATALIVTVGVESKMFEEGHIYGLLVTLVGVTQMVAGYALCTRLLFLGKGLKVNSLRRLKF